MTDEGWDLVDKGRLRKRIAALDAALRALMERHEWDANGGQCICEAHETARKLLAFGERPQ